MEHWTLSLDTIAASDTATAWLAAKVVQPSEDCSALCMEDLICTYYIHWQTLHTLVYSVYTIVCDKVIQALRQSPRSIVSLQHEL